MPRPIKKGPPIQFRLPLAEHAQLAELASASGRTPRAYIEALTTRHLKSTQAKS